MGWVGLGLTGRGENLRSRMRSEENGRNEDAGVLAHAYMKVKQCPMKG
jgi:hypothetical protein